MTRRMLLLFTVLTALAGVLPSAAGSADAPTPLTPANDASHALAWTGTVAAAGSDSYWFVARLGKARTARVTVWVDWGTPENLNLQIRDAQGGMVDSSAAGPGETEIASFDVSNGAKYEVRVVGSVNGSTPYQAYTWVRSTSGRNFKGPGALKYTKKDVLATIDVPINVVFVGFDSAEVEANKQTLLDQLPPSFRPAIRIAPGIGGTGLVRRDGGPMVRQLLQLEGGDVTFEPLVYRYKYNIVAASEAWSKAFMAAAKAASSTGDYQLVFDRDFIERYNARAGALRGAAGAVAPGSEVQFVDGMKLEDWVAAHPPAGLDFDLAKPANGYTYFVVDSFRPSYASQYYDAGKYHNFRVMNELTTDPDSGSQNGFDWGRVWGGRYRFLMLDAGAAPNGWEAGHYPTTKIFRVEANGDSSLLDPPVWHYTPETIASFYSTVGEDVQYAIWMRFTRGYLYRPEPYDKFILAANTWHDAAAYTPWPSKLEMLYKDQLVLQRYKELIPYASFESFSNYKYLTTGDPEQQAIDEGKQQSVSGAPAPFTVNTKPTMRLIDRNREKYAPLEAGAFTIPVVNVVFEGLSTWSLPAIVGGIAEGEGGEAWGQLQNVNNRTKWPGATGTVTDSSGASHSALVPDARVEGVDNIARFGFTATALHEAGHFLGLSHNHDAVAYDWKMSSASSDVNKGNGYYEAIDWMYTTTATPMGYGWEYNRFEVMDKDNVWIGHSIEWLTQAQEALADAYAALDSKGFKSVSTGVRVQQGRAEARIAAAVAALKGGRYLDAVYAARAALAEATRTIDVAATQVLGSTVKPRAGVLPATGVGSSAAVAGTLFASALALAAVLVRRERAR